MKPSHQEERMSETPLRHCRFEGFHLDVQTRELRTGDGSVVALTGKAFDTLCCLIESRHRVVGKDELLAAVWPGRVVEENNLTQAISALRRALGSEHRYIATVSGRGYRFVAEVQTGDASVPEAAPQLDPAVKSWRRTVASGVLLCLLVVLAVLAWQRREPPLTSAPPTQQALAVLPFRNLSPEPRDEILELGFADTLIARVSHSTTLRVRSFSSSLRAAGANPEPLDVGRQLAADYVLEGTIQHEDQRMRVNARLLAVSDGRTIWSGTLDESIDRAFALQDGVAAAVTSALALNLPVPDRSPCDGANVEAYRAYLSGRYQLNRPSAERMRKALTEFRRAIDLDPTCARAYAGLAFAYRSLAMTGDQDPKITFPLAKAAVKQALAINPELAEAYASQGFIAFWYDWDWAGAEASLKRAIELNPSLVDARMAYAHLLSNIGRYDEATTQARQAVALDPLSPLVNTLAASFVRNAGHIDEAQRGMHRALELEPDFWIALLAGSRILTEKHDYAGAIADLRRARELCGDCSQVVAVLGRAYALAGDRDDAAQILAELEQRGRAGYMPATSLATVRNALGDSEGALDLLERAYEQRDIRMSFLKVDERWDNLRTLPRFEALMQRMGLDGDRARIVDPENTGQESEKVRH
jgi:DNA-binding winged helix-turn-helix (wHTH) protein/TolB-like protein/Tfp pilus assembly protein PilF